MKRLLLLAILAGTAVAHADSGSLPNGATLSWDRLFLHENNSKTPEQPLSVPQSLWNYFNMAHCECSQATHNDANPTNAATGEPYYEGVFEPELVLTPGTAPFSQAVDFYTGTMCDNDLYRDKNCVKVGGVSDLSSLASTGNRTTFPVQLYDLMQPQRDQVTGVRPGCEPIVGDDPVWVLAKTMNTQTYDYSLTKTFTVDTWAPCAPTAYTVSPAENAIELKWTASTTNVPDIAYYQALCATSTDQAAFTTAPFAPRYDTSYSLCGRSGSETVLYPVEVDAKGRGTASIPCMGTGSTGTTGDAGVPDAPALAAFAGSDAAIDAMPDAAIDAGTGSGSGGGTAVDSTVFGTLDKKFICGESASATATSMRIQGLQNGTSYKVALLTIDKYRNVRTVFFDTLVTPRAVTDFWEDLHDQGSHVQGGFCLISAAYGDNNPLTNLLRSFRDDTLGGSGFGRLLSRAYYATLGKLGPVVARHLALRILAGLLLLPFVLLALLWHFLTLPGIAALVVLACLMRRRALRMRMAQASPPSGGMKRAASMIGVALVLLVASQAHAQSPYWEDQTHTQPDADAPLLDEVPLVKWHVGVRVGPYVPQIDAQLGVYNNGKGPYQQMFGGYSIMPMIDIDRVLWRGFGQLGAGLSIGYLGKSAHAWLDTSKPSDPTRMTSPGDTNSFRLIPLAVSAVYRFTVLDDDYGIPLVPYARAGLGYYVWWVTAPSGDLAFVCSGGGQPPCSKNTAAGGSLGVVGSIGLAIRAERIDEAAARSMRESGIEHAGFFGELSMGKVDGFGSDKKLSVGDTTWFAGAEFEF